MIEFWFVNPGPGFFRCRSRLTSRTLERQSIPDPTMATPWLHAACVSAPTNIAVIKYWGKADVKSNTPINSSVSVTLDQADLRAVTTVAGSPSFTKDRLWLNGNEEVDADKNKRFRACIDGVKALASDTKLPDGSLITRDMWQNTHIHVSSYNTFPTAAGLASSAAGYAALVAALAKLMNAQEEFPNQFSTIARQGSGSACRSLYGGFVAWRMGSAESGWVDSKAEQIADEKHWPEMRALILVVSDEKKDTSSTAGMGTSVATSSLLAYRAKEVVPLRMKEMEAAWLQRNFATFGKLTMQDSNQFHATCLDTYPPIFYMNDVSRRIVGIVTAYNKYYGDIRTAYTFDAGPNAVLYVLEKYVQEVGALMLYFFPAPEDDLPSYVGHDAYRQSIQEHQLDPTLVLACGGSISEAGDVKKIYYTRAGPGPQELDMSQATLDLVTGLNTFQPSTDMNNGQCD